MAPRNMIAANQKSWANLSFKLTEEERDEFVLDAAKRKMKRKALFQAAMQLWYSFTAPLSERVVPQNRTTPIGKRWVDLPFKVTQEEKDEFVLEAAKRGMKYKALFQAAMQLYRDTYPVPVR